MTGQELASSLIAALNEFAGRKGVADAFDIATSIIEEMSEGLTDHEVTNLLLNYQEFIAQNRPSDRSESLVRDLPPVPEAGQAARLVRKLLG